MPNPPGVGIWPQMHLSIRTRTGMNHAHCWLTSDNLLNFSRWLSMV